MKQYFLIFATWQEGEIRLPSMGRVIKYGDWKNIATGKLVSQDTVQDVWATMNAVTISNWEHDHIQSWVMAMVANGENPDQIKRNLLLNIPDADIHGIVEVTSDNEQNIALIFKDI